MDANLGSDSLPQRVHYVPVGRAELFCREIGRGQPLIVLHGGPDFDHSYLLPDMDRLSDSFRLIYYDQRGRGKSARNVQPGDVTLESDVEDLERLRNALQLPTVAVLGHSWGGLLAMEYAIRHPDHLSHLILLNTAPASHDDYLLLRQALRQRRETADIEQLAGWHSDTRYQEGDPDTVAAYYRIHFKPALRQQANLEIVVSRLRRSFTKEGILKAREIEERLMNETWLSADYNLLPRLKQLSIPTLIIHGDYDFIPLETIAPIAQAIPGAHFISLPDIGHFSFLESRDEVRRQIVDFFRNT